LASGAHLALVRIAHELWDRGLVSGSSGNLSARLDDDSVLITPTGCAFARVTAADLVHCDPAGTPLNAGQRPSVERPLHLAAYRARPDIRFVLHTHPTFCVVWSQSGRLFPRDTVAATESLGPMAWVPFAPSGSVELADALAQGLASGASLALLENHGLIAVSYDIDTAFIQTDLAEACAQVAYYSSAWNYGVSANK
jgi:ribulose-5-phosphate 4-epimerase/fuculose-1-phosphate aldolase